MSGCLCLGHCLCAITITMLMYLYESRCTVPMHYHINRLVINAHLKRYSLVVVFYYYPSQGFNFTKDFLES